MTTGLCSHSLNTPRGWFSSHEAVYRVTKAGISYHFHVMKSPDFPSALEDVETILSSWVDLTGWELAVVPSL